ncbi:MAG: hypothetical protein JWR15_4346 [Prosthecobacter sp.]|nr:hypothetical protein [Prosthecobacter sp.]
MSRPKRKVTAKEPEALFGRVVSILDQARGNVVRAVNSSMVLAYWLIGREIVQALQGGAKRAVYGKKVVEELSARLTERYGKGYSVSNLWYFRQFHLAFQDRLQILHPVGGELSSSKIPHPLGGESATLLLDRRFRTQREQNLAKPKFCAHWTWNLRCHKFPPRWEGNRPHP